MSRERTELATATALMILPMIPTGRQPYLLQSAEATGAIFKNQIIIKMKNDLPLSK